MCEVQMLLQRWKHILCNDSSNMSLYLFHLYHLPPPTLQKKQHLASFSIMLPPPPKDIELWPFPELPCHHSRHSAHRLSSPWYYLDLGVGSIRKYHKTTSSAIRCQGKCYKWRIVAFRASEGGHFRRMACLPNTCAVDVRVKIRLLGR